MNDDIPLSKYVRGDPRVVMGLGIVASALSLTLDWFGVGGPIVRTSLTVLSVACAGFLVYELLTGGFRSATDTEIYDRVLDDD